MTTLSSAMGVVAAFAMLAGAALAEPQPRPQLFTNEAFVGEATRPAAFDIRDPMTVLAYVLGSLPARVTVYPTENYYYFKFVHAGVPIAGNLRFDPRDRDQGKVHFGYYEELADWKEDGFEEVHVLDASRNVTVARVANLTYRVTYRGTSVEFALNDVSQSKPPGSAMGPDERLIGTVFDESGVRFFLVYNAKAKVFAYILDESAPADELGPIKQSDRILIGKRTGFAYYRDHRLDRKILIGVFEQNVRLNTFFDGPFDQLPENFIEGETLRQAIIDSDPEMKGLIDQLGNFLDGDGRYAIATYMHYRAAADLVIFHRCATDKRVPAAAYYRCFVIGDAGPRSIGRPLALQPLRGPRR